MKRSIALSIVAAQAFLCFTGCAVVVEEPAGVPAAPEEAAVSLTPQDDYFGYVNSARLAGAEFEQDDTSAGSSFDIADDLVRSQMHETLNRVLEGSGYAEGTEEYLISNVYEQFIEYSGSEPSAPSELEDLMHEILDASSPSELLAIDARMTRDYGVTPVLNISIDTNYVVPDEYALFLDQYRTVLGYDVVSIRENMYPLSSVKTKAMQILRGYGVSYEEADSMSTSLAYYVLELINSTDIDLVNTDSPYEGLHTLSDADTASLLPNVDLDLFLGELGISENPYGSFLVRDEGQLAQLDLLYAPENLPVLKTWMACNLFSSYSQFMAVSVESLRDFYTTDHADIEEQAFDRLTQLLPEELSCLYTLEYYNDDLDASLRSMCDDIRGGYEVLIRDASWLSEETRADLLDKLHNMIYITGSDVTRHDPSLYTGVIGSDYFETYRNLMSLSIRMKVAKIGTVPSRTETSMPMGMVNACFIPSSNSITITPAIVNAPFFSQDADYYTNLGGLGMVIAHEMGHAFDNTCILFDADGRYDPDRIPEADMAELTRRNEAVASYFEDNFTVYGVYHVDGHQTLGENYADLGAMECITSLCDSSEQLDLLFRNYATIWCEKILNEAVLDQLEYDEHSPSTIRVNAVLSTIGAFYDTYGVSEGDGMYIDPALRVSRWY